MYNHDISIFIELRFNNMGEYNICITYSLHEKEIHKKKTGLREINSKLNCYLIYQRKKRKCGFKVFFYIKLNVTDVY